MISIFICPRSTVEFQGADGDCRHSHTALLTPPRLNDAAAPRPLIITRVLGMLTRGGCLTCSVWGRRLRLSAWICRVSVWRLLPCRYRYHHRHRQLPWVDHCCGCCCCCLPRDSLTRGSATRNFIKTEMSPKQITHFGSLRSIFSGSRFEFSRKFDFRFYNTYYLSFIKLIYSISVIQILNSIKKWR